MEEQSEQREDRGAEVAITVNDKQHRIHRGRQAVAAIKSAAAVALADDLIQVVRNKPVPLADDGSVTIKGGEIFISHPKGAGSS